MESLRLKSIRRHVAVLSVFLLAVALQVQTSFGEGCSLSSTVICSLKGDDSNCCGGASQPCKTIRIALSRVQENGTIFLYPGTYTDSDPNPLTVATNLSIEALSLTAKTVIDCNKTVCFQALCRTSSCRVSTLSLKGFTITNGVSKYGGCIQLENYSLRLTYMLITNCNSTDSGGAISLVNSTAIFFNSTIDRCSVLEVNGFGGGGIYSLKSSIDFDSSTMSDCNSVSHGGGIYADESQMSVYNSNFSGSTATGNGGCLYTSSSKIDILYSAFDSGNAHEGACIFDFGSDINVTLGKFLACQSMEYGGAMHLNGSKNVIIKNTQYNASMSGTAGGGIYAVSVSNLYINGSLFQYNYGFYGGAGMHVESSTVLVTECKFLQNTYGLSIAMGGGMYIMNSVSIVTHNNFTENGLTENDEFYGQQGGGFYYQIFGDGTGVEASLYMASTVFYKNRAQNGGGFTAQVQQEILSGITSNLTGTYVEMVDVHFDSNYASFQGGGLALSSPLIMRNCTFVNNIAGSAGGGFSVQTTVDPVLVDNCTFISNSCLAGKGGGIQIPTQGITNVTVSGSYFYSNNALDGFGGGLYHGGTSALVKNCTFVSNFASISGGAIALEGSGVANVTSPLGAQGVFEDCIFEKNHSPLGGGAFYAFGTAKGSFVSPRFTENNSTKGGAIMLVEYVEVNFTAMTCDRNLATEGGGCLALHDMAKVVMRVSAIHNNSALNVGGGARLTGVSQLSISGTNVTSNRALDGGGIWSDISSFLSANRMIVDDNNATFQGAGFYQTHKALSDLRECSFSRNVASLHGSAILIVANAKAQMTNCNFTANLGTSVLVKGSTLVEMDGCLLRENSALGGNGGALWVTDQSEVTVRSTKFYKNDARNGGAVYVDAQAVITVNESSLFSNIAVLGGAMAAVDQGVITAVGSIFTLNQAFGSGGALAFSGTSMGVVTLCNFTQNEAAIDGGGVFIKRDMSDSDVTQLGPLSLSYLTFNHNTANTSQGAAFFDGSFLPSQRTQCLDCNFLQSSDTKGTIPTYFRFLWPGRNDMGINDSFRVLASSGDPIINLDILVLDLYGNLMEFDNSSIAEVQPTPRISGFLTGAAKNGHIGIPSITVTVQNGDTSDFQLQVTISSPINSFPPSQRSLTVGFCPSGEYYNSDTYRCEECRLGEWCPAGHPPQTCEDDTFSFLPGARNSSDCSGCTTGLRCRGGNSTVLEGFWLDPTSVQNSRKPAVYGCDQSQGCAGFQYKGKVLEQCKTGYQDRVCAACASGYYGFLSTCTRCAESYKNAFLVVLIVVIGLWILLNGITAVFTGADTLVVEMQFLAVVGAFNLKYFPGTWINSIFQVFNITLFYPDFLGPECFNGSYTFVQRWAFTAVLPLGGVVFSLIVYFVDEIRNILAERIVWLHWFQTRLCLADRKRQLLRSILNLLDLLYFSVTIRCLQVFRWQQFDKKVLAADPTIVWLSKTHVALLPFAVVYTAFYVIGVPLFYSWVLFHGKLEGRLHEKAYLQKYGGLYDRYEPDYWWWYIFMTAGRRLAYAAIFVFFSAHPDMQAYLTFLVILIFGLIHYFARPHKAAALDILVGVLLLGQYLYLLAGTANSYMTPYVAKDPSEVLAGIALLLYLISATVIMGFEMQELWARFWVRQWARANGDGGEGEKGTKTKKKPKAPIFSIKAFLKQSVNGKTMPNTESPPGEELVPLEEITAMFNPHVMAAFLQNAEMKDINTLQIIQEAYSDHVPNEDEIRQAGRILDCLPKSLRFSFINELLTDADELAVSLLGKSNDKMAMSSQNGGSISQSGSFNQNGSNPVSLIAADSLANLEKVQGLQRVRELKLLAEAAAGDKKRAGVTLQLLLSPQFVEAFTAWLLYGELEGRRAVRELLGKFNQWLLVLPSEPSWFWFWRGDLVASHPYERQLRRRLRRFSLKLAL